MVNNKIALALACLAFGVHGASVPGASGGGASAVTAAASDAVTKVPTQGEIDSLLDKMYKLVRSDNRSPWSNMLTLQHDNKDIEENLTILANNSTLCTNITNWARQQRTITRAKLNLNPDESKKLFQYLMLKLDPTYTLTKEIDIKYFDELKIKGQGYDVVWPLRSWSSWTPFAEECARIMRKIFGFDDDTGKKLGITGVLPRFKSKETSITGGAYATSYGLRESDRVDYGYVYPNIPLGVWAYDIDFYSGIRLDLKNKTAIVFVDVLNYQAIKAK